LRFFPIDNIIIIIFKVCFKGEGKVKKNRVTFEEIVKQNENRLYYQLCKLGVQGTRNKSHVEGLQAMRCAYKFYDPDKGTLATYFNYHIRNRLIDLMGEESKEKDRSTVNQVTSLT
jgi:hypothetical protein